MGLGLENLDLKVKDLGLGVEDWYLDLKVGDLGLGVQS